MMSRAVKPLSFTGTPCASATDVAPIRRSVAASGLFIGEVLDIGATKRLEVTVKRGRAL